MEKKKFRNKLHLIHIVILVLILCVVIITSTYAYFQVEINNGSLNPTNIDIALECIEIDLIEVNRRSGIQLDYDYPVSDEWAKENIKPIKVKITNKCTNEQGPLNYTLVLTTLKVDDNKSIPDSKIRQRVKRGIDSEIANSNYKEIDYLDTLSKLEGSNRIVIENELKKEISLDSYSKLNHYIIDSNTLAKQKTNTYEIYLWMDYYEGDKDAYNGAPHDESYDNQTQGQTFTSIVSVIANLDVNISTKDYIIGLRPEGLNTNELLGDMYRYQGATADNYICIGSSDCKPGNDEMYRIIGITSDGQIKVMKETSLGNYNWYSSKEVDIDWPNSNLFKVLNTNSDSFINTLPIFIQEKMISRNWYYGDLHSNYADKSPDEIYKIETGEVDSTWLDGLGRKSSGKWKQTSSQAKVGLLYIHDYAFAANSHESSCVSNGTECITNWMHITNNGGSGNEWIMSRDGQDTTGERYNVWHISEDGTLSGGSLGNSFNIRPVFYLDSDIKLSGKGTTENPFIINTDIDGLSAKDYILGLGPEGLNTNKLLGDMYRYQGSTVENYLCIGLSNCKFGSNEMYRIIGVTDNGEIKVMKQKSFGTYSWNSDRTLDINWPNSNLFKVLNTNSDAFINTLPTYIKEKIVSRKWYYGDLHSNYAAISADEMYDIETGSELAQWNGSGETIASDYWKKTDKDYKIGLIYLHDYAYAANSHASSCVSNADDCLASWMHITNNGDSGNEWILSRMGLNNSRAYYNTWYINSSTGTVSGSGLNGSNNIRPVFYLSSDTKLSGQGKLDNPFVIIN